MKTQLPSSLRVDVLSKWTKGDEHHFTLNLSSTHTGQDMTFSYSGGSLAFVPEARKSPRFYVAGQWFDGADWNAQRERHLAAIRKHCPSVAGTHERARAMEWLNQWAKIDPAGVVHSLILDAQTGAESFDDYVSNFVENTDSISQMAEARRIYDACQATGEDLRRVLGDMLPEIETLLADY